MGHARFTKDIDAVWEKLKKEIPDIKISEKTLGSMFQKRKCFQF